MNHGRAFTLYYGEALDAKRLLEEEGASGNLGEVAAALINALERIHQLEQTIAANGGNHS